jgi:alpha-galactosidase
LKDVYEVDPDAVYFRSARNLLDPTERGILQDVAAILEFKSTSDPVSWLQEDEREELRRYLSETPVVEQTGRFAFRLDGRDVDLTAIVAGEPVSDTSFIG